MRILVVEDHALVREALLLALRALGTSEAPADVVGAKDADAAEQCLGEDCDFDLMILDLMLPGMGGIAYLGVVRKRYPHIPVVVLSALDDAATVAKVMRQGAAGFVSKSGPTEVMLGALREVLAGEVWLPPEFRDHAPKRHRNLTLADRFGLTKSQLRVLELLSEGKTNREIAKLLEVTEGTVKTHASAIFRAFGVNNRSQALLVAQGKK